MQLLMILFIAGAIVVVVRVVIEMLGSDVMPLSCPKCFFGGDEDLAGQRQLWYDVHRGRVRCRCCYTWFREHPNGSLVEDR